MAAVADDQDLQLQVLAKKCIRQGDQVVDVPLQQVPLVSVPTHIQYDRETEWKLIKPLNRARGRYTNKSFDQENWSQQLAFYIGVDTISFAPVFSAGPTHHHKIPSQPSYGDNSKSIQSKARPYGRTNGRPNTLLDEYMFTDGALGFTERLASNHAATVARIGLDIIREARDAQEAAYRGGYPIIPFMDPAHDADGPVRLATARGYLDGAYTLRLPRIRKATVTKALLELAIEIQAFLHRDNIHVNEIIVAIFVYFDHQQAPWYRIEPRFLNADHSLVDQGNYIKVPDLKMLSFISMFPHYLRMHELHRLVTYTHPYRFVEATRKAKDTGNPPIFHEAYNPKWLATAASEVCLSGLTDNDWVKVLPSSLLGSQRRRPVDADEFAAPSAELHRDLGLSDINMIGHPVYPVSDIDTTAIIVPAPWLSPVILSEDVTIMHRRTMTTSINVMDPRGHEAEKHSDGIRLLQAPVLAVFPVQEDVTPRDPRQDPVDTQEFRDAVALPYVDGTVHDGHSFVEEFSPRQIDIIKRALEVRLAVAKAAGLTNELVIDDNGLLTIPGLANRPANQPAPFELNSPSTREKLDRVIGRYLRNKPHHVVYNSLLDLDFATAPAATVKATVARIISEVEPLVEDIRHTGSSINSNSFSPRPRERRVVFHGLSEGLIAPMLQLVGSDLGVRRPAVFDPAEVLAVFNANDIDNVMRQAARAVASDIGGALNWDIQTNVLSPATVVIIKTWITSILARAEPILCLIELRIIALDFIN